MHVLLIYCHPRVDSFCAALRDAAISALKAANHTVELRDLYAEGFALALSADERGQCYDEAPNLHEIEEHVSALQSAEALVLVYPTWWCGLPAMLKGWFDRIWVPGVAFHLHKRRGPPAAADQHSPDRGDNHLWLAAVAALVCGLAGLAHGPWWVPALVRATLPARLDRNDADGHLHGKAARAICGRSSRAPVQMAVGAALLIETGVPGSIIQAATASAHAVDWRLEVSYGRSQRSRDR